MMMIIIMLIIIIIIIITTIMYNFYNAEGYLYVNTGFSHW